MLEKMERMDISLAKSSYVVGVTSHDKVYFRSMVNVDCGPSEAPFGRTPLKKKNTFRPAVDNVSSTETELISKLTVLNLSNNKGEEEKFELKFQNDLARIDELTSVGKIEEPLLLLLRLLDEKELKSGQKLKVHKMIASRGIGVLEWHKDLEQKQSKKK